MSLNPLNELKRRLEDDTTALPKRLCLARNVVHSHYFPAAPKERVVAEWLNGLTKLNKLNGGELKSITGWLSAGDGLSSDLKSKLIQCNPLKLEEVQSILDFVENEKISKQVTEHIDENLIISVTLLQTLSTQNEDRTKINALIQRILKNLVKHYKESKKKLEFIIKFLDGKNLETIFGLLDTDNHNSIIEVCQNILFPVNKKSFFVSFLQTLIRKDNIDDLIAEKGDNIQSVLKIMSAFFEFPSNRTTKDHNFLCNFVDVFVSCFQGENQLIFAFYIMVSNSLNMPQNYLTPNSAMPSIIFEENNDKIKRSIFLRMLKILLQNEVDITTRLTDTFGEKISKAETRKNFSMFIQGVLMGLLKLEGKPDKTTMNIINTALKLDPMLIEQKMDQILPPIMAAKKNSSAIMETYTSMLKCLLQTLFKLSRGTSFITQILPNVKLILEASNTEQFGLIQKKDDSEKIKSKIITGNDVMPKECVDMYGKWTSELMFRQNSELLVSLQKDFEIHCLMMLEEGFVSPSIITLCEVLSAILSSFFENSKMADHTVPRHIAEDFWNSYRKFENECLKKLGECVLKLNYCLNLKYGNIKVDVRTDSGCDIYDFNAILPCLSGEQWATLAGKVKDEARVLLDHLVASKVLASELLASQSQDNESSNKSYLIKQLTSSDVLENEIYIKKIVFANLQKSQAKQLAKHLVKLCINEEDTDVLERNSALNNRILLNALVIDTLKNTIKCFDNTEALSKAMTKTDFDLTLFLKNVDVKDLFSQIRMHTEETDVSKCVQVLKQLPIYYLEEKYQLISLFVLLLVKNSSSKKLKRIVDNILQSLYELSPKNPDLYKIFPVDFIFSFEDKTVIDLLTLKIKTSNNLLLLKSTLETGVKKVKTDSAIVKNIVQILLAKQTSTNTSSIEYFCDPVFQISCLILPIIAKEKKAITTSAFRSILANLQEKIHKAMLDAFKNIDFGRNSSLLANQTGNPEDSMVVSDNTMAALNAMEAYSLTLSKYCETNDTGEIKNLECLWSGLEFFMQNASSIHLLNVVLRYIKKLETHDLFKDKDKLFLQIWRSLRDRLLIVHDHRQKGRMSENCLENIGVALKFLWELSSVECFGKHFVGDLSNLATIKDVQTLKEDESATTILTSHRVAKYLSTQCLKANIIGPKCAALSKLMYRISKNLRHWIQDNFEYSLELKGEKIVREEKEILVEDAACDLLTNGLEILSEVIFASKRITLDYKFLDSIFELQHLIHCILGCNTKRIRCTVSWPAFFKLYRGSLTAQLDRQVEDKMAEAAHSIEKLTDSICKKKTHISRLAAYTVADISSWIERTAPSKMVRQHLENSVVLLIQASDSTHAMAFLRRALAGSPGQMTMTNLYSMYKSYVKQLKRRLEDDTTALPKRLCLARNVVHSHYFPAAPKERVVAEWLNGLTKLNKLNGGELKSITGWLSAGNDVMPKECVDMYGKWTSELMFRQNSELLVSLQKDFEIHCLMMLEEGFVSPSIITLCEVLSAILSSFFENSKMADHTVPRHIAEDFWNSYRKFENECLKKLGECVLKLNYASGVTVSDACKTTYEEIKKDKKHRYVVFYIRDEKQIDVETVGERNAEYDQFLEHLQQGGTGECRYGLFDFEYTHQCQGTSEASKKQKLFLMSSFDALKKSLVGVQKYIQATDLSEASQEAVEEKLRATDRQ
ncbi:hypothetical protein MSG28_015638 [Choristoneura fumiferana]|uniref:Uncharacterized protein n=1 Tax=Choristoneura fumiferana TaxID=7141 RepID=A0ACC0KBP0_CHOFU|nr:hypothetical protein MSG28_015638 [Choristoneura fumiferana]